MRHAAFLLLFLAAFAVVLFAQAPTNVLNPASDLAGKTLVTAEGNRTISGVFTFTAPPLFPAGTVGAPGLSSSADATTGWQLSVGSIGGSLGGVQRFLLNSSGLAIYGVQTVDNTGLVTTAGLGSGAANAGTFLRGDRTWAAAVGNGTVCGRLTLTTATPVTTADVLAATTLYYTPISSCNQVVVWNGTVNIADTLTETSIAVPATTSQMYDVFAFDNAGAINIEVLAWTNDTTRATAITVQNGYLAKAATPARRYIGSFRTTTVSGQTEDSAKKRYVWNYYNRVTRPLLITDAAASWAYTTATWRQANANTADQIDLVVGVAEDALTVLLNVGASNTAGSTAWANVGIGEDSITAPTAPATSGSNDFSAGPIALMIATSLTKAPAIGRHYYAWLEAAQAAGTMTWYGTNTAVGVNTITSQLLGQWRG
jgi:hypothetical protein